MPNLDGTGPEGKGSRSGRKEGRCRENKPIDSESEEKQGFISRFGGLRKSNKGGGNFGKGNRWSANSRRRHSNRAKHS